MLLKIFILIVSIQIHLSAQQCAEYFNPDKFYQAPDYLQELLSKKKNYKQTQTFDIIIKEIYRFRPEEIANSINNDFEGFWEDWTGDAYELYLKPEYTKFQYDNFYFSLKVIISGVVGDATHLKGTQVKYHFYNYTKNVNRYKECIKQKE